jgi:hypothetical protein
MKLTSRHQLCPALLSKKMVMQLEFEILPRV